MAKARMFPGFGMVVDLESGTKARMFPGAGMVIDEAGAAPPAGAIMNQLQSGNLGADLYNGTIL